MREEAEEWRERGITKERWTDGRIEREQENESKRAQIKGWNNSIAGPLSEGYKQDKLTLGHCKKSFIHFNNVLELCAPSYGFGDACKYSGYRRKVEAGAQQEGKKKTTRAHMGRYALGVRPRRTINFSWHNSPPSPPANPRCCAAIVSSLQKQTALSRQGRMAGGVTPKNFRECSIS